MAPIDANQCSVAIGMLHTMMQRMITMNRCDVCLEIR